MDPKKAATDFWYEFDNVFLWERQPDVGESMQIAGDLLSLYNEHRQNRTYPEGFVNEINQTAKRKESIIFIDNKQMELIVKHFGDDLGSQQRAFEYFGQGVLFDDRKPRIPDRRVHMMDEDAYGYRFWHAFVRAGVLLNGQTDPKDKDRWLATDRCIGLAWEIQTKQNPSQSSRLGVNPNNPEMDSSTLERLRSFWLSQSYDGLDRLFDKEVPQHN